MEVEEETEAVVVEPEAVTEVDSESLKDGKRAWIVCITSCLLQVLIVGNLHAFGVFFNAFLKEFNSSKGKTAYGLSMLLGPVTSSLVIRFGNRLVVAAGSIISFIAVFSTSYVTSLDQMFLTYSFLFGIGVSLSYTPTMCIADDYFKKYLTQAVGIMTAGSSIGTLVLSPIAQALIDSVGWRVAFRIMACFCLVGLCTGWNLKPLSPKPVFIIWVSAQFVAMFGFYIPYIHMVSYAEDLGIPPEKGSIIMMTMGASTATGRVLFGKIVDLGLLNRVNMHQLSMVATGTGSLLLPTIKSFGGLMGYVIVMGLVDGCFVVLLPTLNAVLAGAENKVLAWGYLVGVTSITFTLGPPVAGWIYDATGNYNLSFTTAGVPIILGAIILFLIPWAQKTGRDTNLMTAAKSKDQFCHNILDDSLGSGDEDTQHVTLPPFRTVSDDVVTVTSVTVYQGDTVLYEKSKRTVSKPLETIVTSPLSILSNTLPSTAESVSSHTSTGVPITIKCSSCKRSENVLLGPRSLTARTPRASSRSRTWSLCSPPEQGVPVSHVQSGQASIAPTDLTERQQHSDTDAYYSVLGTSSTANQIILPVSNGHIVVPSNMPIISSNEFVAIPPNSAHPSGTMMLSRSTQQHSGVPESVTPRTDTPQLSAMVEAGVRLLSEEVDGLQEHHRHDVSQAVPAPYLHVSEGSVPRRLAEAMTEQDFHSDQACGNEHGGAAQSQPVDIEQGGSQRAAPRTPLAGTRTSEQDTQSGIRSRQNSTEMFRMSDLDLSVSHNQTRASDDHTPQ